MKRIFLAWALCGAGNLLAAPLHAQDPSSIPQAQPAATYEISGAVRSGKIPLPGVTITVSNTLTGKKFVLVSGLNGTFVFSGLPRGRYVVRAEFVGFAAVTQEALLNPQTPTLKLELEMILASRAQQQQEQQQARASQIASSVRGFQSLAVENTLAALGGAASAQSGQGMNPGEASLLPLNGISAGSATESVSISGAMGRRQDFGGGSEDDIQERIREFRERAQCEGGKLPIGQLRDTVKLAVDQGQRVRSKNVQYNTGFVLPPGLFRLKFVVRENQTGRMGSFETDVQVPDLRKASLKMSSVVLANQRVPFTGKKSGPNPLVQDHMELVPNVAHVFRQDQHLYLQYEVYDPARNKSSEADKASGQAGKLSRAAVRVLTSVEFLQGTLKVYESKLIVANELTAPERKAVLFQIDMPLQSLKPGLYICQVNIVDDAGGNFAFPRLPLLIRESTPAPVPSGK